MSTYYTPPQFAELLIVGLEPERPKGIIDPTVGDGSLLLCSAQHFPNATLYGVDVDQAAVSRCRLALPDAVVSKADALNVSSVARTLVWRGRDMIDTVVINPPFSGVLTTYRVKAFDQDVVSGLAGAHLLSSIEFYDPDTVAAILPCSFFHSDRDRDALRTISRRYDVSRAGDLQRSAFAQARASCEIVYLRRRDAFPATLQSVCSESDIPYGISVAGFEVGLVRGGVQVHKANRSSLGGELPFIHTKGLADSHGVQFMVSPGNKGVVYGVLVLLPRVGLLLLRHLRVREIGTPIQLSDCVLALCFASLEHARVVCDAMRDDFDSFRRCWAGTGAPYTTVSKVCDYLERLGVACIVASNWPDPEIAVPIVNARRSQILHPPR